MLDWIAQELNAARADAHGGRWQEARRRCGEIVAAAPECATAWRLLGVAQAQTGGMAEAADSFAAACRLEPGLADGWLNLGNALLEGGRAAEAIGPLDRAIALAPGDADAHYCLANALLQTGQFARGWEEYEWRWKSGVFPSEAPPFTQPLWDGSLMPSGTILLHCEQGFGDSIQFARYVPLVAQRVGRVLVDCYPPLGPLFASLAGATRVIPRGQALPAFDVHCPLLSLPGAFGTTLETIPSHTPYLKPPAEQVQRWRATLAGNGELRVGLAWAGGTSHPGWAYRDIPLRSLAPLADVAGVRFHSLQVGPAATQASDAGFSVTDWSAELIDFGTTAALIANLDLVITVDTAVAHLSGSLGIPTCTMLGRVPNWRWPMDHSGSAWYPAMQLFWQKSYGQWDRVVREVKQAVESAVARASLVAWPSRPCIGETPKP